MNTQYIVIAPFPDYPAGSLLTDLAIAASHLNSVVPIAVIGGMSSTGTTTNTTTGTATGVSGAVTTTSTGSAAGGAAATISVVGFSQPQPGGNVTLLLSNGSSVGPIVVSGNALSALQQGQIAGAVQSSALFSQTGQIIPADIGDLSQGFVTLMTGATLHLATDIVPMISNTQSAVATLTSQSDTLGAQLGAALAAASAAQTLAASTAGLLTSIAPVVSNTQSAVATLTSQIGTIAAQLATALAGVSAAQTLATSTASSLTSIAGGMTLASGVALGTNFPTNATGPLGSLWNNNGLLSVVTPPS